MTSGVVVIVGMHRSGTSLTAELLSRGGLSLGEEFVGIEGDLVEDRDFVELHEKIFRKCGIPYGGFEHLDNLVIDHDSRRRIEDLLSAKSERTQWGFKDPRTCLFLGEYLRALPDASFLFLYRDYRAVIDSLVRRRIRRLERNVESARNHPYGFPSSIRRAGGATKHRAVLLGAELGRHRHAASALRAWITYNRSIERAISELDDPRWVLMSADRLRQQYPDAIAWLRMRGIVVAPPALDEVFDADRYTTAPSGYRLPRALEDEAGSMLDRLDRIAADRWNRWEQRQQ